MISTIIIWAYIAFITLPIGILTSDFIRQFLKSNDYYPSFEITSFGGIAIFTSLIGYISIWYPINYKIHIFFVIISIIVIFFKTSALKLIIKDFGQLFKNRFFLVFSSTIIILTIIQSVKPPFWIDVGGYHAQAIQWIEKYGTVKGLANLHDRFGYNNSSHLVMAFFNASFVGFDIYQGVSSYFFICYFLYSFRVLFNNNEISTSIKVIVSLSLLLLIIYYRDWISSPSSDLICSIYLLVIANIFLIGASNYRIKNKINIDTYFIFILAAASIATKISSIPVFLILIIIVILLRNEFNLFKIITIAFLVLLIILPIFIRNYFLSGYLLFPFPSLDIFDPDWKLPVKYVIARSYDIYNFTRNQGHIFKYIPDLTYSKWLNSWFIGLEFYNKIILLTIATLPILLFVLMTNISLRNKLFRKFEIVVLTTYCFIALIFWFLQAPSFRFAHGFLIPCFGGVICMFSFIFFQKGSILFYLKWATCIVIFLFGTYSITIEFKELINSYSLSKVWLSPMPYPSEKIYYIKVNPKQLVKVPYPEKPECWNCDIPCTPEPLPKLEMRGDNLIDGFRIKSSNSPQKSLY